jgi:hypothetical protein
VYNTLKWVKVHSKIPIKTNKTEKVKKLNTRSNTFRRTVLVISYIFLFKIHCGKNWMRRIRGSTRRGEDAVLAVSHNLHWPSCFTTDTTTNSAWNIKWSETAGCLTASLWVDSAATFSLPTFPTPHLFHVYNVLGTQKSARHMSCCIHHNCPLNISV